MLAFLTMVLVGSIVPTAVCATQEPSADRAQEAVLSRHLEALKGARTTAELERVRAAASRELAPAGRTFKHYLVEVCNHVASSRTAVDDRNGYVRKVALDALATEGEVTPQDRIRLLLHLQDDAVVVATMPEAERAAGAVAAIERWSTGVAILESLGKPAAEESVELSVAPPEATGLPAGVDPSEIADPALRAEYERRLAERDRMADRQRAARELRNLRRLFLPRAATVLKSLADFVPMDGIQARLRAAGCSDEFCRSVVVGKYAEPESGGRKHP